MRLSSPSPPSLLSSRDAEGGDYATFARLFLELKVPDPTPTEAQYELRIRPHTFFLLEGANPVAYAFWQAFGEVARVSHVVVDSAARGRGVGQALMREIGVRGRRAGCTRCYLSVKPDNVPALRLYARSGLSPMGKARVMEVAWADVSRLAPGEGAIPFTVTPDHDREVERAAGLFVGQIEALRAGGGRVFIGLRGRDESLAFAAFEPSVPHAMLFVAPRLGLARDLLEAMRPHALAEHARVRFVVLNEELVQAAMRTPTVLLETIRMEGPLQA
jgi:GNAT superfamily N-acetyltransferase